MLENGAVVTHERSKVLSLHGVLNLVTKDEYSLKETEAVHHHGDSKARVCSPRGLCGVLVTILEVFFAFLFPVVWAAIVLVVHAVRRCLSKRRAAKRRRALGISLWAISLPIGRPLKRVTLWEKFKRLSTNKKMGQGNARRNGRNTNKKKEPAAPENKIESKLEVKADIENEGETIDKLSRPMEKVGIHRKKTFRRGNMFDLNALLDSEIDMKKDQEGKLVHHNDALFYLHASPRHLEKHLSSGKYMDSILEKAGQMAGQREKYRNGDSTWAHHEDHGAESDTDWETDESEVE